MLGTSSDIGKTFIPALSLPLLDRYDAHLREHVEVGRWSRLTIAPEIADWYVLERRVRKLAPCEHPGPREGIAGSAQR